MASQSSSSQVREQLVEQLSHRLLSLEVGLQDAARSGLIRKKQYRQRTKMLKLLHSELTRLSILSEQVGQGHSDNLDLGLPRAESCSPEELEVCVRFVDERRQVAQFLSKITQETLGWAQGAAMGTTNWFSSTLQLSKLRKRMQGVERWLGGIAAEERQLNRKIKELSASVNNHTPDDDAVANITALIALFDNLNRQASTVMSLRQKLQAEESRIAEMRQWLAEKEEHIRTRTPQLLPPSMVEATEAENLLENLNLDPIRSTEKRLGLARKFLEAQISETSSETFHLPQTDTQGSDHAGT